jgi:SDR family mycofactocin-dependent oxidoreductase
VADLSGQVAFITGAARGQGRAHALGLARAGADVVAVDICRPIETVTYPLATPDDLAQTVRDVRALGRRVVSAEVDVRDRTGLDAAVRAGVSELGGLDIVVANAGIMPVVVGDEDEQTFADVIGVNLVGVWNTVEATKRVLLDQGRGGSIVLVSSSAGLRGYRFDVPGNAYVAAKHGVLGLMRNYALALGPANIRVNSIHPTGVTTPMITNGPLVELMTAHPEVLPDYANALPIRHIEPGDVTDAVLWLVSDQAKIISGVALPIDGGHSVT